jgi:hypothetical protein
MQAQIAGVAQARYEPQAEEIEEGEHELGGAVRVGGVLGDWQLGVKDSSSVWIASRSATETTLVPYWLYWSVTQPRVRKLRFTDPSHPPPRCDLQRYLAWSWCR